MAKAIRSMTVTPHGKEGFTVTHDHQQSTRGEYTEPQTHVMKTHGEMLHHVHEHMKGSGSKQESDSGKGCPFCEGGPDSKGGDKEELG